MTELEFARRDDEGRLVLLDPEGGESSLSITPALKEAVNGLEETGDDVAQAATPTQQAAPEHDEPKLEVREVQGKMRAGVTVAELEKLTGLPLNTLQKLEFPVAAEREHVISNVREHQVTGLMGTAELGRIADRRLATRGIEGEAVWTARREGNAPWVVEARYTAAGRERFARWTYDPRGRIVTSLDDEARWLSQPDDPLTPETPPVTGGTTPVTRGSNTGVVPLVSPEPRPNPPVRRPSADAFATEQILDDLAARRGSRPADSMPFERPTTTSIAARLPGRVAKPNFGRYEPVGTETNGLDVAGAPWQTHGQRHPSVGKMRPAAELADPAPEAQVLPFDDWLGRRHQPEQPTTGSFDEVPELDLGLDVDVADVPLAEPEAVSEPVSEPVPAARPATGSTPARKKGQRPTMPSWDEVLLGTRS